MSMIFQSYAIWPNMTVAENVGVRAEAAQGAGRRGGRRVDEMLDVVQLARCATATRPN